MTKPMEQRGLRDIWKNIEKDNSFGSWEVFETWARETGHRPRYAIYKLDMTKPHGPDNSYWYWATKPLPEDLSDLCVECNAMMKTCLIHGCKRWKEWFVKNWNEKIHVPKPEPPAPKEPENTLFWRYEHPDLVREGIVFEADG